MTKIYSLYYCNRYDDGKVFKFKPKNPKCHVKGCDCYPTPVGVIKLNGNMVTIIEPIIDVSKYGGGFKVSYFSSENSILNNWLKSHY